MLSIKLKNSAETYRKEAFNKGKRTKEIIKLENNCMYTMLKKGY